MQPLSPKSIDEPSEGENSLTESDKEEEGAI